MVKNITIGIRVDENLKNQIENQALKEEITKAQFIRKAISFYLDFGGDETLNRESILALKSHIRQISKSIENQLNPFILNLEIFYKFLDLKEINLKSFEEKSPDPSTINYLQNTLSNLFGDE